MTETNSPLKKINLSKFTQALIQALALVKPKPIPDELSKLSVSQTVSFLAIVYEKIRNAVEFREEHLVRRAAIERIIKRRLSLNPDGHGESENLIRELLWARYFPNESLSGKDISAVEKIINKYLLLRKLILVGRTAPIQQYLNQFVMDMMTCEIEEALNPAGTARSASFTYFVYQVLRNKIKIEGLSESEKDLFFLTAIEKTYRRSDTPYERYHLFTTFYYPLFKYSNEEIQNISTKIPAIFSKVDEIIKSPYVDSLNKFTKKQLPPFLILFEIIKKGFNEIEQILTHRNKLWQQTDLICREKYQQIGVRLRNLAIKSFVYIFLTKMIFALILEYPVSLYLFGMVNNASIVINSIFPPILMLIIIFFFRIPGEDNTVKIYQRIIHIIDADKSFETTVAFMPKKPRVRKPSLIFGFTIFYSLTFIITLFLIYEVLSLLNFNLVSQAVFIFFVSLITFFSYRIKQIVNEYRLEEKESIFSPVIDFFFMPILSIGKFFSQEIAKLNFFMFIFDFLIEAPFKLIFEVVEEWISFVKKRKEEII